MDGAVMHAEVLPECKLRFEVLTDHETRLRTLEQWHWRNAGLTSAAAALAVWLGQYVLTLL